jgi:exopolysaccharide production protein ExoQ
VPSFFALILCTAFVAFLIWLDHRQSPHMTWALWIPTIWMLHASSKPLAFYFQSSGATMDSSPLDRAFLLVLMALAIGILVQRRQDWMKAMKENGWVTALLAFMLFSVVWSSAPATSFTRWVRELLAFLMALVVCSEPFPRKSMVSLLRRTVYILIPFSMLLIKYFPAYGIQFGRWSGVRMWIGVTMQKNGLGRLCMISFFFLAWSLIRRMQGRNPRSWKYETLVELSVLGLVVALLKGPSSTAYSATALGALAVGLLVLGGLALLKKLGKSVKAGFIVILVVLGLVIGIATPFTGGAAVGSLAPTFGRNSTLTDRDAIWRMLVPLAMKNPVIGGGFGGFWTSTTRMAFEVGESHNGYLDVILGLGFAGIFLISMFLLSSSKKAMALLSQDFDWGALWIGFIIMAVIHNITETSIDSLTSQLTAVILFLAVASTKRDPDPGASLENIKIAE